MSMLAAVELEVLRRRRIDAPKLARGPSSAQGMDSRKSGYPQEHPKVSSKPSSREIRRLGKLKQRSTIENLKARIRDLEQQLQSSQSHGYEKGGQSSEASYAPASHASPELFDLYADDSSEDSSSACEESEQWHEAPISASEVHSMHNVISVNSAISACSSGKDGQSHDQLCVGIGRGSSQPNVSVGKGRGSSQPKVTDAGVQTDSDLYGCNGSTVHVFAGPAAAIAANAGFQRIWEEQAAEDADAAVDLDDVGWPFRPPCEGNGPAVVIDKESTMVGWPFRPPCEGNGPAVVTELPMVQFDGEVAAQLETSAPAGHASPVLLDGDDLVASQATPALSDGTAKVVVTSATAGHASPVLFDGDCASATDVDTQLTSALSDGIALDAETSATAGHASPILFGGDGASDSDLGAQENGFDDPVASQATQAFSDGIAQEVAMQVEGSTIAGHASTFSFDGVSTAHFEGIAQIGDTCSKDFNPQAPSFLTSDGDVTVASQASQALSDGIAKDDDDQLRVPLSLLSFDPHEHDIKLVMGNSKCSRAAAEAALQAHGNAVSAIMFLLGF